MAPTNMPAVSIDINMFWQIINFFILVLIFNKYFKKPITKVLDARKAKISEQINQAEADKVLASKAKKEAEEMLKAAKAQANQIVQTAEKKADERKEEILGESTAQRDKMLKSAEFEIHKMKESAKKELEVEMNGLAVQLAEKIIKANLDSQTEAALADKFIDEVGEVR
ncbi:MAG: F0F1 ATP synthase subunit B [Cetobacterium sp.]|uniref:F0F1 ATP synthase subunit B n=1 Tax=unclassified Cetobacterium TaxID=2630983 RepID=UPI00163D1DFD|nr:F0F1 ATP synthase subunit B [Cetobacterium sp. 2A]MBC2856391.1 F0F1 ATP synthase subunit B [Cetobacterium sp. 2A]